MAGIVTFVGVLGALAIVIFFVLLILWTLGIVK